MPRSWASSICTQRSDQSQIQIVQKRRRDRTHHNDAIFTQERIHERFAEEHAISHVLDACPLFTAQVLKADRVSNLLVTSISTLSLTKSGLIYLIA